MEGRGVYSGEREGPPHGVQAERRGGSFLCDSCGVHSEGAGEDSESGRLHGGEDRRQGAMGRSAARAFAEAELACLLTNKELGDDPAVFVGLVFAWLLFLHAVLAAARTARVAVVLSVFFVIVKRSVVSRSVQILIHLGNLLCALVTLLWW